MNCLQSRVCFGNNCTYDNTPKLCNLYSLTMHVYTLTSLRSFSLCTFVACVSHLLLPSPHSVAELEHRRSLTEHGHAEVVRRQRRHAKPNRHVEPERAENLVFVKRPRPGVAILEDHQHQTPEEDWPVGDHRRQELGIGELAERAKRQLPPASRELPLRTIPWKSSCGGGMAFVLTPRCRGCRGRRRPPCRRSQRSRSSARGRYHPAGSGSPSSATASRRSTSRPSLPA